MTVQQFPPTRFHPIDAAKRLLYFKDCDLKGGFLPWNRNNKPACDSYFAHKNTQLNLRVDPLPDTGDVWPGQKPLSVPLTRFLDLPANGPEPSHGSDAELRFRHSHALAHRSSFVSAPLLGSHGQAKFVGHSVFSSFLDTAEVPPRAPRSWKTIDASAHRPEEDSKDADPEEVAADVHRDIEGHAIEYSEENQDSGVAQPTESVIRNFIM